MPKNRDIELDSHFFVPPGVIDVRQENERNYEGSYSSGEGGEDSFLADSGPILANPGSAIPNAPSGYRIIRQDLRTTPDGRVVVDVELEFPDTGADIDIRMTPA